MIYLMSLTNPMTFQLNQIRTYNFQLKLVEAAVTLKYGHTHSHQKWHEHVKLNE